MPEHDPDLLVLPRVHLAERLELIDDEPRGQHGTPQKAQRGGEGVAIDERGGLGDLRRGELEPQLGALMHGLEQQLVAMHRLLVGLLQRKSSSSVRRYRS